MKLSAKTIISALIVTVIAVGVVSAGSFYLVQNSLKNSVGKNKLEVTRSTMEKIDRVLYGRYVDIQSLADNKEFEVFLSKEKAQGEALNKLKESETLTGPWDILSLFDTEGSPVVTSGDEQTSHTGGEESRAVKRALAGEVYVSDVVISEHTGRPTVIFAAPVRDETTVGHPVVGSMYGEFSWPVISEILKKLPLEAHLFSRDGALIASNGLDEGSPRAGYQDNTAFRQAIAGEAGFAVAQDFDKQEEALFAFSPQLGFLEYEGSNWRLMTEVKTEVAFASARRTAIRISILLAGLLAVLSLFLLLFLQRLVISPIKDLSRSARKIAQGDLETRAEVHSNDEIGQLARRFNEMVGAVKKSSAEVEKKVKEQTKEIKEKAESLDDQREAMINIAEDAKQEEERTEKEKKKTKSILESIGDGVFVVNEDLEITIFNDMAEKISGFKAEEAIGKNYKEILKFVFEDNGEVNDEFINQAIETGEVQEMSNHTVLIDKNGNKISVADSASPLKNKEGEVEGCVVVFRDVSKQRKINRMKTEFVSLASHQLRTPLTSMRLFSEMLIDKAKNLKDKHREYLENIQLSTRRMIKLVNDLLNVSRLESGRLKISPESVDYLELVRQEANDVVSSKDKECSLKLPDQGVGEVELDKTLMRQVVRNLLTNAIRYTDDECEIKVELEQDSEGYLLKVADNGIGIPKEEHDKVFEKFSRAYNAKKVESEGTGLGLYLAKMTIETAGGEIWFESEGEGQGTTFYVQLPPGGMQTREGEESLAELVE